MIDAIAASGVTPARVADKDHALWQAAKALEASFLEEMLKSSGLGETSDSFGGGAGEDHFASFMRQIHARQMVEAGGIGLAQSIFEALKEGDDGTV